MTAPFFCDRPVKSSVEQAMPSTCAAMPSNAPMVITPVPPMPVTRMLKGASSAGSAGCGRSANSADGSAAVRSALRSLPPSTVTKLGQKPSRQEKSLLQLDWLIRRLRPSSVSSGWTETQFELRAVAAAFADALVDEDALRRIGIKPALAAAAFFGGAGLVVDQHREAGTSRSSRCTASSSRR